MVSGLRGLVVQRTVEEKEEEKRKVSFYLYNMYPSTLSLHTRSLSIVLAVVVLYLFSASM